VFEYSNIRKFDEMPRGRGGNAFYWLIEKVTNSEAGLVERLGRLGVGYGYFILGRWTAEVGRWRQMNSCRA
jgi:hypothetical protein